MTAAPETRRWWIMGALMTSLILVGLDSTVLNVALPTLATGLHATTAQLQWVLDAYILVLAGLMLPLGALADRIGRKRVLLAGVAVFTAGSLAAAYAGTAGWLIATRAVMGVGAAVILTVPLAVLPSIFTPAERPRALATVMVAMGLGLPLGPIVGGWLLQHFWWGSVFLINVPLGVASLVALALLLPDSRDPGARRTDAVGAVLSTAGLVAVVYAVVEAPTRGWTSAAVLGCATLGLVLLVAFAGWERRTDAPMVDLGLFGRPRFSWGTLCATVATFAMLGMLFVLPLYFQAVQRHDPLGTGLRLLPMIAGLVVGAKVGERATTRLGNKLPVAAGLAVIVAGLLWGTTVGAETAYPQVGGVLALLGVGLGVTMTPAMDAALGEIPESRAGSGSALSMAVRQVGGALGIAVLGSVLNAVYTARLDVGALPPELADTARESVAAGMAVARTTGDAGLAASATSAYVDAMGVVMLTSAGVAVAGLLVALLLLPARAARTAAASREPQGTMAS